VLRLPALSLVSLLVSAQVWATDVAHELLVKMTRSTRALDYEGSFVYQHDNQIESMRIIHKVVEGAPRERLVSLNGAPREIVRDAREVRFYYPNDNIVIVEPRRANNQEFPNILPERLQGLDENYLIRLGGQGRVAGRVAQQVVIEPRDNYRYGYRLWADRDTGLLLKAELVGEQGRLLEQFVFAAISVGVDIPASALAPETARAGMMWHRDNSAHRKDAPADTRVAWTAGRLPKGFRLSTQMIRDIPMRKKSVDHLVYSDGLAAVSVFIELQDPDDKIAAPGASHIGAVNAYAARIDGHRVTAMGEVPAATVSLIGASVARRP